MDELDRAVIERLHEGFPLVPRPFRAVAAELGIAEDELIGRLEALLAGGVLTRFGPLYQAERMGGAYALAALRVPPREFDRVAGLLDAMPEVAHNYERAHEYNMWFVLATATPEDLELAFGRIEVETGLTVLRLPKEREYFVGLKLEVAA